MSAAIVDLARAADGAAMLAEISLALAERQQNDLRLRVDLLGGIDRWFDLCRSQCNKNADYRLAVIIVRLLRRGSVHGTRLRLATSESRVMESDPAVYAFWKSVGAAGDDGWVEERLRVHSVQREALKCSLDKDRKSVLDIYAVISLVPLYRSWGQLLLNI